MTVPSSKDLAALREKYPKGAKVRLIHMEDAAAPPVGTIGEIFGVDALGSLMVNWENGSTLNVLLDVDEVELIEMEGGNYGI